MSIKEHQVVRRGNNILLGISVGNAVLDILTSQAQLQECLKLLKDPLGPLKLERTTMGAFGCYPVSLDVDKRGTASIFVDGPYFESTRSQSAAIWVGKEDLERLLVEVLDNINESTSMQRSRDSYKTSLEPGE
jgi:hypothetical protein